MGFPWNDEPVATVILVKIHGKTFWIEMREHDSVGFPDCRPTLVYHDVLP